MDRYLPGVKFRSGAWGADKPWTVVHDDGIMVWGKAAERGVDMLFPRGEVKPLPVVGDLITVGESTGNLKAVSGRMAWVQLGNGSWITCQYNDLELYIGQNVFAEDDDDDDDNWDEEY